ncbi:hypothetical protein [uncultured Friedmanniella sp.]|uniref:hypothetical protein n=1 Tax=uncultured Friedmanniella sp. TaxID=335381 RepID=UPI0035C9BFA7
MSQLDAWPVAEQMLGGRLYRDAYRTHARHYTSDAATAGLPFVEEPTVLTAIDREVERAEETQADWFRQQDINVPPGFVAGTIKVGDHWLRVKPVEDEAEVEVRQATPIEVRIKVPARLPSRKVTDRECVFEFGDCQIGWWFDPDTGLWHPTHDPRAMDVAIQIATDAEAEHGVQHVVNLGDHLDLPSLSKHDSAAAVLAFGALNRSLQTAYEFDAKLAAVTPNADHVFVGGNHDARFTRHLTGTNSPLIGVRRATPSGADLGEPVLTVEYLTRQAETGWRSCGEWPAAQHWIGSNLFHHGDCCRPTNNQTSDKYLAQYPTNSTHYGHIHRAGYTEKLVLVDGVWRLIVSGSPGALCRVDGAVPSARGAVLPTGAPARRQEAWSQGVAILWVDPNDRNATPGVEHIRIMNGQAIWRGRLYVAQVDMDGNPL